MKKNIVGHMMLRKETAANRFRRSRILPKLLCLLVAVAVWLLIVNLRNSDLGNGAEKAPAGQESEITEQIS